MKHLLLTTIAAVVLVGCATTQQSAPPAEAKPVEPIAIHPRKPSEIVISAFDAPPFFGGNAISMLDVASGDIEAVKQAIAAGANVNAKNRVGATALLRAAQNGRKEIAELLIAKGADVNAKNKDGETPLDLAETVYEDSSSGLKAAMKETSDLLRKHGGKTAKELRAEGK